MNKYSILNYFHIWIFFSEQVTENSKCLLSTCFILNTVLSICMYLFNLHIWKVVELLSQLYK